MKKTKLRKVSKQRAKENREYSKVLSSWRQHRIAKDGYLQCQFVGLPYSLDEWYDTDGRCIGRAMTAPHHKKGRHGKLLYDEKFFMALCAFHHSWVEDNKREARRRGLILYK